MPVAKLVAAIIRPQSLEASVIMADRNVKFRPITTGRREPMRQTGYSWMSVPIPAMSMAA